MDPQEAEQTLQEMFGPLLGKRNTPTEDAAKTNPSERPNKTGKQNDGGEEATTGHPGHPFGVLAETPSSHRDSRRRSTRRHSDW